MRALDRKLFRDVGRMRAQAAAIALVVAAGVSLFVATVTAYRSLRVSEHHYYTQQRFAQVWSGVARAPSSILPTLAAIPGVTAIEGRIVERAVLDIPGLDEPASALVVSIPGRIGHALDDLHIRRGRHVEPGEADEVLVSEAFAEKNHLALGSSIAAVVAGRRLALRVVGVALSPEYVMPMAPGALAVDDRRFGVLWMERGQLEALVDLRGAFNEVAATLARGTDERTVIATLDRALAPYGGQGAYGRTSHPSHMMLEEHIDQLRSMALIIPSIFLLVSAFLVNVVLSRVVSAQREQVGMLKAFGYGSGRIAWHYLELTALIVLGGIAAGLPVGAWLGRGMARFYASFFRFPVLVFRPEPAVLGLAAAVAVGAATLGTLGSLRKVMAMPPVVAMSAEVPAFRRTFLDRLGVEHLFGPASRMIVRNLTRRPLRSVLAVAGMALAVAVMILGGSSADAITKMVDVRYQRAERADVTVALAHPRALGTAADFRALPGVRAAEPFRAVPARVVGRSTSQDVTLVGLPPGGVLRRVVATNGRVVPPAPEGVLITKWLAQRFGLRRGDLVTLEIRENERRDVTTRLIDAVDEPLGLGAYMDLGALGRLLGEPETYSGASLAVDAAHKTDLYEVLKRTPAALAVDTRVGALAAFHSMSDRALSFIRQIEVVFSVIIAFGVVYNSARIALAERGRELATLRVLGFTRAEVSRILLGEVGFLAVPAIPTGFAVGYWLSSVLMRAMNGERMHFAVVAARPTYALAAAVFTIAGAASALVVRRGLDRLDLVSVLKAKE
ncbi:MAG TPA: ABC transporter permease [Polyangia bacterium]|nr:ABC transporter permease [Polyangia bacterium]